MGEPNDEPLPETIGGFPVLRVLGQGGMGRVYACRDEGLDREVAIKVLLKELGVQSDMVERFLREARAMAKVISPHVVTVHQVGSDAIGPFLVMELLDGEDLARRIKREGPLALLDILRFVRDAVAGLQTAAAAGLVHRDVKPENLFVVGGRIKLTDFGLARPMDGSANLTQAGLVVGSPCYLAPELAKGAEADVRSDLYALGATLYEMLAGQPPYTGNAAVEIITAHFMKPVPDVRERRPDTPVALADLVTRLLQKDPAERVQGYADVLAVLDDVERAGLGPAVPAAASAGPGGTQVLGASSPDTSAVDSLVAELPGDPTGDPAPGETQPTQLTPAIGRAGRVTGPMAAVKTETLTVMFTDIAGYTERTAMQSREEAAYWLELHDALLRPVVKSFRGSVVKTIGDALLVTFKSPTDAVLCGCAIQDRLWAHNHKAPAEQVIEVRVALSAGEVRVRKGDVFGEPVNLAARLEKLAHKGDVLLSDAVFATMNTAEVPVDERGEHELKGISRRVKVYAARPDGQPGQPPFGNRALDLVEEGRILPALDAARRRLAGALDGAQDALQGALHSVSEGIGGVARQPPKRALQLAAAAVGALVVVALVGWGVATAVDKVTKDADDPISEWDVDELAAYLPERDVDDIVAELARRDADDIQGPMEKILADAGWVARHNALKVLRKAKLATDAHEEQVAIQDLLKGDSCDARKSGLTRLKKHAVSDAALDALGEARGDAIKNFCMSTSWTSARKAIEKRLKKSDDE